MTWPVDSDAGGMCTQVAPARHAIAAAAAHHMAFSGDDLSGVEVIDVVADLDDFADEFVSDHHRHGDGPGSPVIPKVDMQIRAAERCPQNPDQDIVHANARFGNVFKPQAFAGLAFYQGFHLSDASCAKV